MRSKSLLFLPKPPVIRITTTIVMQDYDDPQYGPSTHETAIPLRTRRYLGPNSTGGGV
jgi:hypothetical protein